jgi:pyridoxine 4-oxidase
MHFDVLVIGAGSAGCVVAARLSEDAACRVGLVEAGGLPVDPDIADPLQWPHIQGRDYDWAYRTTPQPGTAGRVHDWPRGRVVGGSGCLHAMAYVQGHPRDYDAWARAGGARWSWEGLSPGFQRSITRVPQDAAAAGPLTVWRPDAEVSPLVRAYMAAGRAMGVPALDGHNGGRLVGVTPNSLNIAGGRRVTLADAYLAPQVMARPNLRLLTGHVVDRLVFDGTRATGVVAEVAGARQVITADRIVLCAGAVATPLVLMRSGVGDPAMLGGAGVGVVAPLAGVGANLQDHLLVAGTVCRARQAVAPSRLQHSESLMYLDSADLTAGDGPPDVVLACVVAPSVGPEACDDPAIIPAYGAGFTLLSGQCRPASRGRIAITGPGRDAPPLIDPQYLAAPEDRAAHRRALRIARELAAHPALAAWFGAEVLPGAAVQTEAELDSFIARAAITHHHPAGTCRMGQDETAVVDSDLRVHGCQGLFVVDASVIPTLPSGPINAAVVAIAETWAAAVG